MGWKKNSSRRGAEKLKAFLLCASARDYFLAENGMEGRSHAEAQRRREIKGIFFFARLREIISWLKRD
jgi:hypothetical protein